MSSTTAVHVYPLPPYQRSAAQGQEERDLSKLLRGNGVTNKNQGWDGFNEALKQDYESFSESGTKNITDRVFKAIGILGWSICYIAIIQAHGQLEISLIPYQLLAYNIVWEFGRVFFWNNGDESWLTVCFGVGWLGMEVFLFSQFWQHGGGSELSLNDERTRFFLYFIVYAALGYLVTIKDESACRIWRHLSYFFSMLFQLNIEYLSSSNEIPHLKWMLWGMGLGNVAYIVSVRKVYQGWTSPLKHPIRFTIIVSEFIPVVLYSTYGMYSVPLL